MAESIFRETHPEPTWARWVSNIFSPPVIWGVLAFVIAGWNSQNGIGTQEAVWAGIYVLLVCLVPAVFVGVMVLSGRITDIHMKVRRQRILPFVVAIFTSLAALLILEALGAAPLMKLLALITFVEMCVMLAITFVWQISIHMMSATSAAIFVGATGLLALIGSLLMMLVVAAARYTLKRHTIAELIGGGLVGGGLAALLYSLANITVG